MLKQPPPWTADPVLHDYSFCHNYRWQDRGTKFTIENILTLPNPIDRVFVTVFYRLFNRPETIQSLGLENIINYDRKRITTALLKLQEKDQRVFSPAYMTSAITTSGPGGKIKEYCKVLQSVYRQRTALTAELKTCDNMKSAWETIKQIKWAGPFIGYQMVLDLNYDPYFKWPEDDWVYPGPGAQRGVNRLLKKPLKKQEDFVTAIRGLALAPICYPISIGMAIFKYPTDSKGNYIFMNNHDVEFALCEFSKYQRIKDGGKRTRRFVPRS